ncbi:MAG: type I-E CRISPR-associated protein Cse1/CasA, partial [Planctomycetota bacterium]
MDNVALLRFLLSVLLWCKDDAKSAFATLSDRKMVIPEEWLAKLDDHKTAFNLLGDGARFYQDASLKGKEARPIADLLVEFPGADSVNHVRHVVHDGSYGFCPACCALGILRLSVWAPANRYYPASVNPGTGAYAITETKNLLLTLVANMPEATAQTHQAPWLSNTQPDLPGAIANLAWRPRKLWLNVVSEQGSCATCGSSGVLVASLYNEGGWPTPTTDGQKFAKAVEAEFKKIGYNAKGKDQASRNAKKVVKN